MSKQDMVEDLICLVKFFDVDYVIDADQELLSRVDPNEQRGIIEVVRCLMVPEFRTYTANAQERILQSLRAAVQDPQEDFRRVFDRIELAFDKPVNDKKVFMAGILCALESDFPKDRHQT
jgi:hypothetical protein